MRPGDKDALEKLMYRLRHVEATATLVALRCQLPRDESDALIGVAATVGEAINELDRLTLGTAAV